MVRLRIRTKIMTAATFFVMSAAVILGGYDMSKAEATGGTDYVKYTYATGQTQNYTLPEIQTVNYYNSLAMKSTRAVYEDPRPPYYDSAVVKMMCYTYIDGRAYTNDFTGFIIGDHEIMTAAHCVYKQFSTSYGFSDAAKAIIPNNSTYTDNAPIVNIISVHVPQAYINMAIDDIDNSVQSTQDYDYAILTVSEDLSEYGCYLLGMGTDELKQDNVPVHSIGFLNQTSRISHGTIKTNKKLSFDFDLYTYYQSSGAPIYTESVFGISNTSIEDYQMKTYRTVISIVHGAYAYDPNISIGPRIRPIIMQFAYDNEYL